MEEKEKIKTRVSISPDKNTDRNDGKHLLSSAAYSAVIAEDLSANKGKKESLVCSDLPLINSSVSLSSAAVL